MDNKKPKILMIIKENLYSLIFSHIEKELNKKFEIIKIYNKELNEDLHKILEDKDLKNIKGYIASWGSPPVDKDFLDLMPELEIIACAKGSVKGYICQEAFQKGIVATSAHMALAPSVAETTMILILKKKISKKRT